MKKNNSCFVIFYTKTRIHFSILWYTCDCIIDNTCMFSCRVEIFRKQVPFCYSAIIGFIIIFVKLFSMIASKHEAKQNFIHLNIF